MAVEALAGILPPKPEQRALQIPAAAAAAAQTTEVAGMAGLGS
jgi:hypothetical protein